MNLFACGQLASVVYLLTSAEESYKNFARNRSASSDEAYKALVSNIEGMFQQCKELGFGSAANKISLSLLHFGTTVRPDSSSVSTELRNIRESIQLECYEHQFLRVDRSRFNWVQNPNLFGEVVAKKFPSAVPDIQAAGDCLAAECNTAGVFHLMRAVEWGLRALASNLGVRRIPTSKKPGKKKYIPLSYAEWEKILDGLQDSADLKMSKMKRGVDKQRFQEFYYPALQDIRGLRDAWRNHVMHTRAEYGREDANAVLSHVRRLMESLALRIKEV